MALAFINGLRRNWAIISPPVAVKQDGALKFGILGAANIAPMAMITPALSHPEVVVYAVAARDKARAMAFAKKHSIPVVKDSYDEILDDPEIDVVYIPLPAGFHHEWTLKALAKGKHVLLEKPSTSNLQEAENLFHHPLLSQPSAQPVLLEAFHSRFTPAWMLFQSTLDQPNISHVLATAVAPSFVAKDDDIRFNYGIGGGALLDLGTYPVAALRSAFGAEPINCIDANLTRMPPPYDRCDHTFKATFSFPNGGTGVIDGTMRSPVMSSFKLPTCTVTHKPVPTSEEESKQGTKVTKTRKVVFYNFMFPPLYHRIDVIDEFTATKGSSTSKYTRTEQKKAYTFAEMGQSRHSEIYWSTYRYMLEEFVNKVKGRKGSGVWISPEDSIAQARALDMIYEKSGLGARPSRKS